MSRRTTDSTSSGPSANSAGLLRSLFAIEALGNVFGGATMLLHPRAILEWAKPKAPSVLESWKNPATWTASPQAAVLMQWLGALVIALATPLVLGLSNKTGAVTRRRQAYQVLLVGELALIGAMCWQFLTSEEMSRAVSDKAIKLSAFTLGGLVVWRLFVLFIKPSLLGSEGGGASTASSGSKIA